MDLVNKLLNEYMLMKLSKYIIIYLKEILHFQLYINAHLKQKVNLLIPIHPNI